MRIGMLRISQETNAYSPFPSEVRSFRHYLRGDELMQATSRWGREAQDAMRSAELSGFRRAVERVGGSEFEVVPLFSAWAIPSGPLSTAAIEHFNQDLAASLDAAGPLDAVFFCLHGALEGEGGVRPEVGWLKQIRAHLGPDKPLAVSADLHGHISQAFVDQVDIFCAYRTNPHRDHRQTGDRAGALLVRTLRGEIRPTLAFRTLPMVQGGGMTLDFLEPVRPIFRRMTELEKQGRILDASLMMVHLWLTDRELSWSVLVTTDDDPDTAAEVAEELADRAWATRKQMPPTVPGPEEALQMARAARIHRKLGTICMCDASDVVGAGAPGTNTALLRVLLEQGQGLRVYGAIRDAVTVEELWQLPIGASFEGTVGGREPDASPALAIRGTLRTKDDDVIMGRVVSVDLGHLQLVITQESPLVMRPSFYRKRGLHPSRADICVVKVFFPFRLFFGLHNRKTIYVRTEGATDFDRASKRAFSLPTWPRDDPEDWRPADRARRGVERQPQSSS